MHKSEQSAGLGYHLKIPDRCFCEPQLFAADASGDPLTGNYAEKCYLP